MIEVEFPVVDLSEHGRETMGNNEDVEASGTVHDDQREVTTPLSQSATPRLNRDNYDDSVEPRKVRLVDDIYNETEEVILDEELFLMGVEEPANYKQAAKDENWKKAVKNEMESIESNNTWELTTLPPGQKVVGLKWIFKLKKNAEGKIVKHKARLVAKGYIQEHGVDFDEVYAPVTRLETVRFTTP